jgi:hypothetical protein
MPLSGHSVWSSFRPTPAVRARRLDGSYSVARSILLPPRHLNLATSGPIRAAMFRLFPFLLAGLLCPCFGGVASDLTLTGLTRSQGRVWAYISIARGTGSVTLSLNEERAGIKFEAVDFKLRRAWVSEGGSTRCLILGGGPSAAAVVDANSGTAVSPTPIRLSKPAAASELGRETAVVSAEVGARGGEVPAAGPEGIASANRVGGAEVVPDLPHRWIPGVVRPPTEEELFKSRYGSAAWDAESRIRVRAR